MKYRLRIGGFVLILFATLIGCSKQETLYSQSLKRSELMQVVFPSSKTTTFTTQILDFSNHVEEKYKAEWAKKNGQVNPTHVVKLSEKYATLLTENTPDEGSWDCHACSVFVGVYTFEKTDRGWKLIKRQDLVNSSGADGMIGKVSIHKIGDTQFVHAAQWTSTWQGYEYTSLVLTGISQNGGANLSGGIRLGLDNDGSHGACSSLDGEKGIVLNGIQSGCIQIKSDWKIVGNMLKVNFKGRTSKSRPVEQSAEVTNILQEATYQLSGDSAVLISGSNPVKD